MSIPEAPKKPKRTRSSEQMALNRSCYPVDDQQVYCINNLESFDDINRSEIFQQEEVFENLAQVGVDPQWLSAEDALNVQEGDHNFYAIPIFHGTVFHHLQSVKCKVIGTSLISQCLEQGRPIPKQTHPLFSFNFKRAKVCFTGLPRERREHLSTLVRYMNGSAEGKFYPSVTHLVTDRGCYASDKYRAAKTKKIPIMKPEWIEDAWEKAQKHIFRDYTDVEVVESFLLPVFHNMVICTSGISGQERADLTRLIELYGGRSPGEMRRGECSHLVTENTIGAKYRKAKEWGDVKVVTIRWIRKCIEFGYVQDESKFDPAKPQPSTAKNSTQLPGAAAPKDLDVSSIYGPLKQTLISQEQNITARTAASPITPATMPRTLSRRNLTFEVPASECCLDKLLDTTVKGDLDFFEGCTIFVAGVDKNRQEKINRILDRCGATRVNSIERATHIVVANIKDGEKAALIEAQRKGINVLRPEWLVDCIDKKDILGSDEYIWDSDSTIPRTVNSMANSIVGSSRHLESHRSRITDLQPISSVITTVSDQLRLDLAPSSLSTGNNVFLDRTFRLHTLHEDLIPQLQAMIEDNAGCVLEEHQNIIADYLVADQVEYGCVPDVRTEKYKHLVTENFVRHCINSQKVHDSRERPLFRPLPAVSGSSIFANVVFGFVSLGDIDKFTFSQLVRDFGGCIEATIVMRARDGINPCTHVVAGEDGAKLAEFRKKLPHLKIVDPSWIIDCIINDTKLLEANYQFKNKAYDGYKGRSDDFWSSPSLERAHTTYPSETEAPRACSTLQQDVNMEIDLDEPLEFQKCATSTPKAPQVRRGRRSTERFNPRFHLEGVTQILNELPSPTVTEEDSMGTLNITTVGKMLSEAVRKTGKSPAEPRRSITEPVSSLNKKMEKSTDTFYRATPKRGQENSKNETKHFECARKDISEEAALSTRLMQRQMDFLAQLKRDPEETMRSACEASPLVLSKRKRAYESAQDSPTAPTAKRNTSVLEPAVDWHPENAPTNDFNITEHNDLMKQPETEVADENILQNTPEVQIVDDNSLLISMDPNDIPEERRSVQLSVNPQTVTISSTLTGRSTVSINKSKPSVTSAKELLSEESRAKSSEPEKIFLFTGISRDKEILENAVKELGGKLVSDSSDIAPTVTHLICGKLVRGTKLMGCIASGRWVLTPEFLTESKAAGKFLNEEQFEWGNSQIIDKNDLKGRDKQIAEAGLRWRLRLVQSKKRGAFTGWKVLLYTSPEKSVSVVALLEAGDAQVVIRERLKTSIEQFKPTHVIVVKSAEWTEAERKEATNAGCKIFSLEYIASLLLEEFINEEDWYHPDYRIFLKRNGV